jgi:methyl-accepting chemotaxis protein
VRLTPHPAAKAPTVPAAAASRAAPRARGRTAVATQQARAKGFALDLAQGGADPADDDFTDY